MTKRISYNNIYPFIDKHKRQWSPKDEKEKNIIIQFLQLCSEKLTLSLMSSLSKEDIQKKIDMLYNGEINFDHFKELNTDQFYDELVGQGRLFNDTE